MNNFDITLNIIFANIQSYAERHPHYLYCERMLNAKLLKANWTQYWADCWAHHYSRVNQNWNNSEPKSGKYFGNSIFFLTVQ